SPSIHRPYQGFASRDLVTTPFHPSWGTSFRWTQAEIAKLSDDLNDRSAACGKTRWSSWPSNGTPLRPEISTGLRPATSFGLTRKMSAVSGTDLAGSTFGAGGGGVALPLDPATMRRVISSRSRGIFDAAASRTARALSCITSGSVAYQSIVGRLWSAASSAWVASASTISHRSEVATRWAAAVT